MPTAVLPMQPLFFHDARQLLSLAGPPVPRRGADLAELGIIPGGALLAAAGKIRRVGKTGDLAAEARRLKAQPIDCRGRVVMPGFVDSHTHLVFAGSRADDYVERLRGRTYQEIAASGGGIRFSAWQLRAAAAQNLEAQATRYLAQFAAHGTTTVEVKSGYGLEVESELKTLEVVARLRKSAPVELVPTLLAAHAVPLEYEGRPEAWLELVSKELIPAVARRKLAEFIDCFCEQGAFTVDQCARVLAQGMKRGLVPRLHAEQLTRTGATRLAIELGAASADHLDFINGSDIAALARSKVVATLLPGVNFFLGIRQYPPARRLIESGAIVALATDFNPGSSPTLNMQFVLSAACSAMRLTPAEAISASTLNAAYALRRADRLGSLEPGKDADLTVMDVGDYREIPYFFGWNHCAMTVKRGKIAWPRP
ncbi:MAG TPA: imidazolonepropionase [Terriglobia bacterium]|nr:imidazolonepropionase [Terriglobia bacterium]